MNTQEHVYNSADAFREVVDELIQQTKNSQLHWHRAWDSTEEHRNYACLDHRGDVPVLYVFSYAKKDSWQWTYVRVEGNKRLNITRSHGKESQIPDQNMELEEAILHAYERACKAGGVVIGRMSPIFKTPWEAYKADDSVEYYLQIRDDLRERATVPTEVTPLSKEERAYGEKLADEIGL